MRTGNLRDIFRLLGTPTDEDWPSVRELPDYKQNFPKWEPQDLKEQVPGLDDLGMDLLRVRYGATQSSMFLEF
jgi:cyclin-dependent kinase